jgi:hypothetical protein
MIEYSKPAREWLDQELLEAVTERGRDVWGLRTAAQIRAQLEIYQRLPQADQPGFRPAQYSPLTGLLRSREEEGGTPAEYSNEGEILPDTPPKKYTGPM